jgi:putative solute:sodium symporter small subunit
MPPAAPAPHQADVLGPLRTLLLVLWAVSSFGVMYFAYSLQRWVGDWPLTYLLAAQGIVVGFVVLVTVYAWLANRAQRADEAADAALDERADDVVEDAKVACDPFIERRGAM